MIASARRPDPTTYAPAQAAARPRASAPCPASPVPVDGTAPRRRAPRGPSSGRRSGTPAGRRRGGRPGAPSCPTSGRSPRSPRGSSRHDRGTRPSPAADAAAGLDPRPSAIRRVLSRNPVCPIIRCSGRTARPSRCQPRTRDSQACGSVNRPSSRRSSASRDSWVVRGDVRDQHAAGRERVGDGGQVLPRGEHVQDHPVDAAGLLGHRQHVAEVPDREGPGRMRSPEEALDVGASDLGEVLAALDRVQRPPSPTARSRDMVSAPEPTPASTTRGAGEDVGHRDDLAGVLGVDHGGAARHRQHEVAEQRAQRQVLEARAVGDDGALRPADQVVVAEVPLVRVEGGARRQRDRVQPARAGR